MSTAKMPTECEKKSGSVCTPPVAFAGRLCGGTYPDVALAMFAKGTPWTRAYVVREVEAWNASGGRTSSAKMLFEEEVLVLKQREQKAAAVQVGAGGSYDVLRWDGSCVSLMSDEVTLKRPPTVKHAPIRWRRLDLGMRDTLLTDKKIERVYSQRLKECKNGSEENSKCAKAEERLTSMIVEHVSSGGPLAEPEDLP